MEDLQLQVRLRFPKAERRDGFALAPVEVQPLRIQGLLTLEIPPLADAQELIVLLGE